MDTERLPESTKIRWLTRTQNFNNVKRSNKADTSEIQDKAHSMRPSFITEPKPD